MVIDENEIRWSYFDGFLAECPPIPRIGDRIDMEEGSGAVKNVTHILRQYKDGPYLRIALNIGKLAQGEKIYSSVCNL